MNKKKTIALVGAILAIIAAVSIAIWTSSSKNENDIVVFDTETSSEISEEVLEEIPLVSEDGVNLTLTEENFKEIKTFMSKYQDAVVIKEINDIVIDEQGNIQNTCLERIEYHMLNSENKYYTFDTLAFYNDPELKKENVNRSEIAEKYKIDTKQYFSTNVDNSNNTFELLINIIEGYGFDKNLFSNIRLDKENYDSLYEQIKQKNYHYIDNKIDLSFLNLTDDDYDEIISKDIIITTDIYETGDEYISFIGITIKYYKDNMLHDRNLIFGLRAFYE